MSWKNNLLFNTSIFTTRISHGVSLRFRLIATLVFTMVLIVGLGGAFAMDSARRTVAGESQATANLALQLIEAGLGDSEKENSTPSAWLLKLGRLDKTRRLRIHAYGARETVVNLPPAKNPAGSAPGWFVRSVTPEPFVVERQLLAGTPHAITIVVQSEPDDEIEEAWRETQNLFGLIVVLAVAVSVVVYVSIGRAFRPVTTILAALDGIERGDYATRLPGFSLPEFSRISCSFNGMAEALQRVSKENRALTQHSLSIQERERQMIARELHDEMGQSLTAIKAMAASLRKPQRDAGATIDQIMTICDNVFSVLRGIMRALRPTVLDELGLVASLEDLVSHWQGVDDDLDVVFTCDPELSDCPPDIAIHVFRIVQECFTNSVKHARPSRISLHLTRVAHGTDSAPLIRLSFADDGCGFDPEQPSAGFGLLGMRERVNSLDGTFSVSTRKNAGTRLEFLIPMNRG